MTSLRCRQQVVIIRNLFIEKA
jgi:hypothetical protein